MTGRSIVGAAVVLLASGGCTPDESSPGGAASSEYGFDSIPVMVATSDAVVLGTVTALVDGGTIGPPGEEVELIDVELRVEEALYGTVETSPLTIRTLEFLTTDPEWREVGTTVLAFLFRNVDPADGGYHEINTQALYIVTGSDLHPIDTDGFAIRVAAMSLDEVEAKIEQAKQAIAAGKVTAQAPFGG